MRRGEATTADTAGSQKVRDIGADGTFAVSPGDMDGFPIQRGLLEEARYAAKSEFNHSSRFFGFVVRKGKIFMIKTSQITGDLKMTFSFLSDVAVFFSEIDQSGVLTLSIPRERCPTYACIFRCQQEQLVN